ncbi:MAG: hypothetical protein LBF93_02835 [Zoogloeaceae bacterium]|jgi:hypothetical protein|nr:hypothetical protein [Zoogloeaceae bacterium]
MKATERSEADFQLVAPWQIRESGNLIGRLRMEAANGSENEKQPNPMSHVHNGLTPGFSGTHAVVLARTKRHSMPVSNLLEDRLHERPCLRHYRRNYRPITPPVTNQRTED